MADGLQKGEHYFIQWYGMMRRAIEKLTPADLPQDIQDGLAVGDTFFKDLSHLEAAVLTATTNPLDLTNIPGEVSAWEAIVHDPMKPSRAAQQAFAAKYPNLVTGTQ